MRSRATRVGAATFALALALAAPRALASPDSFALAGVYAGTIGTQRDVVQLAVANGDGAPPGALVGDDGSLARGTSVPLTGTREGVELRLVDRFVPDAADARVYRLTPTPDGLSGTLTLGTGEPLDVTLRRIAPAPPARTLPGADAPAYERALLDVPLRASGLRTGDGVSYRTVRDPRFEVTGVALTTVKHDRVRDRANAALRAAFDRVRMDASACLSTARLDDDRAVYAMTTTVGRMTPLVVSLAIRGRKVCEGERSDDVAFGVTVDLRDGMPVDWHAALRDANAFRAAVEARAPTALAAAKAPRLCFARTTLDAWSGATMSLDARGLDVLPHFDGLLRACAVDVTIGSAAARALVSARAASLLP